MEKNAHIKKRIVNLVMLMAVLAIILIALFGCQEADKVSQNIAMEADNFNVMRRVVVINTRTDKAEFECIGRIALEVGDRRLDVIVETDKEKYQKHIINLTGNNMYIIEDLGGADVNKYKYEINYLPEMILPVDFVSKD